MATRSTLSGICLTQGSKSRVRLILPSRSMMGDMPRVPGRKA